MINRPAEGVLNKPNKRSKSDLKALLGELTCEEKKSLTNIIKESQEAGSFEKGSIDSCNIREEGLLEYNDLIDQEFVHNKSVQCAPSHAVFSSQFFIQYLEFIKLHVSPVNEAGRRSLIDVYLFRAVAMLESELSESIALHTEFTVPPGGESSHGFFYYAVMTCANKRDHDTLLHRRSFISKFSHFVKAILIVEAKPGQLHDAIDQACLEIHASAVRLKKQFGRGAVSDGTSWIFIIMEIKYESDKPKSAKYWRSKELTLNAADHSWAKHLPAKRGSELLQHMIAGILYTWIPNSFQSIDSDIWFKKTDR